MARRFHVTSKGIEARFDPAEVVLLRGLVDEVTALLNEDRPTDRPGDPALRRLLPDGYRDDPEAAAELRRLTEADLRAGKLDALRTLNGSLSDSGRVVLDPPAAERWLSGINDLRLTLGTRLDVSEDTDIDLAEDPGDDPRRHALLVYSWLGWLQESLVDAVAG